MNRNYKFGLLLLALLLLTGTLFADRETVWSDWVKFDQNKLETWEISSEHGRMVSLRSKDRSNQENIRKIMVLFPKKSSAYDTAIDKILEVFESKGIQADFVLNNFVGNDELGLEAVQYAESNDVDLIYAMGSRSTAFAYKHYSGGSLPVVSVCAKDPVLLGQIKDYESGSDTNIAYTSLNVPIELQVKYLLELNPDLKNIVILYATQNTSAVATQVKPLIEISAQYGIACTDLAVTNQQAAQIELERKVPATVEKIRQIDPNLSQTIFWITGSTSVFREIETINRYSDKIPVLSVVPDVVQSGDKSAVLSIGVGFESNAHLAALYGAGILAGESRVGELKVGVVTPPDIAINFKKAKDIGLRIPFKFFESATYVYDYDGHIVRDKGIKVDQR